jgi:hypothetical protein
MVNGRITAEQMEWLEARAEEVGGNLSAALRQTITDARLLEMVRIDYRRFGLDHPEVEIPFDDDGTSYTWDAVLKMPGLSETDDLALREQEKDQ